MFLYEKKDDPFKNLVGRKMQDSKKLSELFGSFTTRDFHASMIEKIKKERGQSEQCESVTIESFEFFDYQLRVRLSEGKHNILSLNVREGKNTESDPEQIQPVSANTFICFAGSGFCTCELFEFTRDSEKQIGEVGLIGKKQLTLKNGDTIMLRNGIDGLIIKQCSNLASYELVDKKRNNLVYNFDVRSGKLLFISSSNTMSARAGTALDIISAVKQGADIEKISDVAVNHSEHYIRWKAIETIAELDPDKVKPLLYECLTDSHPEVRQAARETLEMNGYA